MFAWCWKITDAEIRDARPFEGYHMRDRTRWPAPYYPYSAAALPGHAYHVRRLAEAMAALGRWVGPPPVVKPGSKVWWDGSHRVRAVAYLAARGVAIAVPAATVRRGRTA